MWNPHYLTQELNLFEWSLYLPGIDAVTQGQVPYRDFFHLRGPFELYAPAFFMKIFGYRADVLASYFYFGTVVTILTGILIAYELISSRPLLWTAALILVIRTFPRVVFTFWGGMRYAWGLLAVWCLIRFFKSKRPGWLAAAGCLAAIGWWTSIEIGVAILVSFVAAVVMSRAWRPFARSFVIGFLAVSLPYAAYLASQGALGPYIHAQWVVITAMQKTIPTAIPPPANLPEFLRAVFYPWDRNFYLMTPLYCYMFFFVFYFGPWGQRKVVDREQGALALAVYGLMLFFSGFRNLGASQYEMSLQPEKIVLFYLLGVLFLWAGRDEATRRKAGYFLLAAVILSTGIYCAGRFRAKFYRFCWIGQMAGGRGAPEWSGATVDLERIRHMTIPQWQAEDLKGLSAFMEAHVGAHEPVWMYPELGSLHFILHRPWSGRFPLSTLAWMDEGWFTDYEHGLLRHPPAYAVVNKVMPAYFESCYFAVAGNRLKHLRMMQFLHDHYVVAGQTPSYFIYRRIQ